MLVKLFQWTSSQKIFCPNDGFEDVIVQFNGKLIFFIFISLFISYKNNIVMVLIVYNMELRNNRNQVFIVIATAPFTRLFYGEDIVMDT